MKHPAVCRIAYGVQGGSPGSNVIGLVERLTTPGVPEVVGHHDLGLVPPYGRANRSPERDPVLQHAIGQPKKIHGVNADDPGRLDLLGLAYPSGLVRVHAIDAGFTAGHQGIHHTLSLISPACHSRRSAEFKIIWMSDDAERRVPRFVDGFEI